MDTASMGLVYADIELVSGDDLVLSRRGYLPEDQIKRLYTRSLVDSGATMLAIPEFVKTQLDLRRIDEIEAELADGSSRKLEVVGPVEVRFENRRTLVEALVVPDSTQVLLGAIPMEGMDVLVDPKQRRLIVNPESPEVAKVLLM
ncbi:aspartyl protease family protein [Leptodesmis sichuanensis]|uniref:aspartyl protease family protein n=1 Tax=Leptodesmis sichuanensis TaxID=2906798 RepID=UPI001F1731F5|nr:aspartyl protease family protein [Leptodesmis sichuanensis]UIE39568.1 clan AA aspartic protease [Leptodesmis sichuanensis A121]